MYKEPGNFRNLNFAPFSSTSPVSSLAPALGVDDHVGLALQESSRRHLLLLRPALHVLLLALLWKMCRNFLRMGQQNLIRLSVNNDSLGAHDSCKGWFLGPAYGSLGLVTLSKNARATPIKAKQDPLNGLAWSWELNYYFLVLLRIHEGLLRKGLNLLCANMTKFWAQLYHQNLLFGVWCSLASSIVSNLPAVNQPPCD